jgi:hypothetical protein
VDDIGGVPLQALFGYDGFGEEHINALSDYDNDLMDTGRVDVSFQALQTIQADEVNTQTVAMGTLHGGPVAMELGGDQVVLTTANSLVDFDDETNRNTEQDVEEESSSTHRCEKRKPKSQGGPAAKRLSSGSESETFNNFDLSADESTTEYSAASPKYADDEDTDWIDSHSPPKGKKTQERRETRSTKNVSAKPSEVESTEPGTFANLSSTAHTADLFSKTDLACHDCGCYTGRQNHICRPIGVGPIERDGSNRLTQKSISMLVALVARSDTWLANWKEATKNFEKIVLRQEDFQLNSHLLATDKVYFHQFMVVLAAVVQMPEAGRAGKLLVLCFQDEHSKYVCS